MKTIACIIARTNSTRLPQKVLKDIHGKKMIEHIIDKIKLCTNIDEIYICTSIDREDAVLSEIAIQNEIKFFQGSRTAVIDRMLKVADLEKADNVIRITGDNVFTDEIFLQRMIDEHIKNNMDYTRTEYLPLGVTAEIMKVNALKHCFNSIDPNKSEYLSVYMFNPDLYKCLVLIPNHFMRRPFYNLSVDTQDDWERTLFIMDNLYNNNVYIDDILKLHEIDKIPYLEIDSQQIIKLADGEVITFEAFRKELERKISKSCTIELEMDFYEKNKH